MVCAWWWGYSSSNSSSNNKLLGSCVAGEQLAKTELQCTRNQPRTLATGTINYMRQAHQTRTCMPQTRRYAIRAEQESAGEPEGKPLQELSGMFSRRWWL